VGHVYDTTRDGLNNQAMGRAIMKREAQRDRPLDANGHSKPRTCKTIWVTVRDTGEPDRLMWEFWRCFGNHRTRTIPVTSKVVTHCSVVGDEIHLVVEYTTRGGYPSDIRRWAGNLVWGRVATKHQVECQLKETEILPD